MGDSSKKNESHPQLIPVNFSNAIVFTGYIIVNSIKDLAIIPHYKNA